MKPFTHEQTAGSGGTMPKNREDRKKKGALKDLFALENAPPQ